MQFLTVGDNLFAHDRDFPLKGPLMGEHLGV